MDCGKNFWLAREIITGSLNALAPGQYVFIESTAERREGYFYQICKEAQANLHADKKLTPLNFRFHLLPWWHHTTYRIESEDIVLPSHYSDYFNVLAAQLGVTLDRGQRAWYVKRASTQGEDMKREFPSTPEEAFESSNEGLYYGRQIVEAGQQSRLRNIYCDANVPVHTAWDSATMIQRPSDSSSNAVRKFNRNSLPYLHGVIRKKRHVNKVKKKMAENGTFNLS